MLQIYENLCIGLNYNHLNFVNLTYYKVGLIFNNLMLLRS